MVNYCQITKRKGEAMKNEKAFFESAMNHASPGWTLKLAPEMTPGQLDLARFGVRIYLVDTSSDWVAAGAAEVQAFDLAAAAAKSAKTTADELNTALGRGIAELARNGFADAQAEQGATIKAMQVALAALTHSKTFELVKPRGLAGHWVYLAYRCLDASIVTRPTYFNRMEPGFVTPQVLASFTRSVIQQDLANGNSSVARQVKKGGGAMLAVATD